MGRQSFPPRTPPASWVGRGSIVPGARRPNGASHLHKSLGAPTSGPQRPHQWSFRVQPSWTSSWWSLSFPQGCTTSTSTSLCSESISLPHRQGCSLSWSSLSSLLAQGFRILHVWDYSEAPRGWAPGGAGAGDSWWAFGKAFDVDVDYR